MGDRVYGQCQIRATRCRKSLLYCPTCLRALWETIATNRNAIFVGLSLTIYTNNIVRSSLHGFCVGCNFFSVIFDHLFQLKDADLVTPEPLELHVFLRHNSELMTAVCEAIINCIKKIFEKRQSYMRICEKNFAKTKKEKSTISTVCRSAYVQGIHGHVKHNRLFKHVDRLLGWLCFYY